MSDDHDANGTDAVLDAPSAPASTADVSVLDILNIFDVAGLYHKIIINQEIADIHNRITSIYKHLSEAHLDSARQAIEALANSKNPEAEMRSALADYRNAYNICAKLDGQTRGFWRTPVVQDRIAFFAALCHLSALIVMLYLTLGEQENADKWSARALENFDKAATELRLMAQSIHYTFTGAEPSSFLASLSFRWQARKQGGWVERVEEHASFQGDYSGRARTRMQRTLKELDKIDRDFVIVTPSDHLVLSDEGMKYIEERITDYRNMFNQSLNKGINAALALAST